MQIKTFQWTLVQHTIWELDSGQHEGGLPALRIAKIKHGSCLTFSPLSPLLRCTLSDPDRLPALRIAKIEHGSSLTFSPFSPLLQCTLSDPDIVELKLYLIGQSRLFHQGSNEGMRLKPHSFCIFGKLYQIVFWRNRLNKEKLLNGAGLAWPGRYRYWWQALSGGLLMGGLVWASAWPLHMEHCAMAVVLSLSFSLYVSYLIHFQLGPKVTVDFDLGVHFQNWCVLMWNFNQHWIEWWIELRLECINTISGCYSTSCNINIRFFSTVL